MKRVIIAALFAVTAPALTSTSPNALAAPIKSQVKWRTFSTTQNAKSAAEVKAIQFLLRARGFYKAQPDGVFGAQTAAAVKAFQRKNGLKADGVVGAQTFSKLVRVVKRGDRGDFVRAVQVLLRDFVGHEAQYPYADLKVDGVFGYNTESAVRDYQGESQVGGSKLIKISGVVTNLTWALFFHSDLDL